MTANEDREPKQPCGKCGTDDPARHAWVEGDCVLPHRNHSRATIGHVCRWCVERHQVWLAEIVELYATLGMVVGIGSIPEDRTEYQKPRKAPASPALMRLAAWAMLNDSGRLFRTGNPDDLPDVPDVLATHAQQLFESLEWTSAAPSTVSGASAVLSANAERVAVQPWVDEYDADLRWLRRQLRMAHGLSETRKPVGRCPSLDGDGKACNGPLWPQQSGGMAVECADCHRHFGEGFLRHLGGMLDAS